MYIAHINNKGELMMNRQPKYTKDNAYRVVSIANGYWRLQRYENFKGTKTIDPWSMAGLPTDYTSALCALHAHEPIKRAA